jgi:hypothetical protein
MSPTASSGGSAKNFASANATAVSSSVCTASPVTIAFGNRTTRPKSATVSDSPSPSMMTPSASGSSRSISREDCM